MQAWEEKYYDREEARNEGIFLGEQLRLIKMVCKKMKKNCSVSDIAEMLEEDTTTIQSIYDTAKCFAPDYDLNEILKALMDFEQEEQ